MNSLGTTSNCTQVIWQHQWPPEGAPIFRIGRTGDQLVAEWPGFGELRASPSGDWSEFRLVPGADAVLASKFRDGVVRALLEHLRGRITLHGSAVLVGDAALVFLGDSGSGKSTTAADMCATLGVALLADDMAGIEVRGTEHFVVPTEKANWLAPDVLESFGQPAKGPWKTPVSPARLGTDSGRLTAMIKLEFEESAVSSFPLRGSAAFAALSRAMVRFDLEDPAVVLRDLDGLSKLAASVPLYTVRRSARWSELKSVRDLSLRVLQSHQALK